MITRTVFIFLIIVCFILLFRTLKKANFNPGLKNMFPVEIVIEGNLPEWAKKSDLIALKTENDYKLPKEITDQILSKLNYGEVVGNHPTYEELERYASLLDSKEGGPEQDEYLSQYTPHLSTCPDCVRITMGFRDLNRITSELKEFVPEKS